MVWIIGRQCTIWTTHSFTRPSVTTGWITDIFTFTFDANQWFVFCHDRFSFSLVGVDGLVILANSSENVKHSIVTKCNKRSIPLSSFCSFLFCSSHILLVRNSCQSTKCKYSHSDYPTNGILARLLLSSKYLLCPAWRKDSKYLH